MSFYLIHVDSVVDIDWHGEDTLWGLFSDFFNVHTAIWGSDNDWSVELSVHKDSEVGLSRNVKGMGNHDLLDRDTFGQSLLGSEAVANHLFDIFATFDWVRGKVDSSLEDFYKIVLAKEAYLESGIESSLSSASSKDLSLDNELGRTRLQEVFTTLDSLGFVFGHSESLDTQTVLFHKLLRSKLLEVKGSSASGGDLSEHFKRS